MGCGSSVPQQAAGAGDDSTTRAVDAAKKGAANQQTAQNDSIPARVPAEAIQKSKSTRARRLSYVTTEEAAQTMGKQQDPGSQAPQQPRKGGGSTSSSTRVRRLSYVTNDPNMAQKLSSGQQLPPEGEELGAGENAQELEVPEVNSMETKSSTSEAPVKITVACMSRAGREPGFKKTNQDNCFAFEKYISGDQSLFGAMDGHGPQGHLVSGYVKQHLPIILVNHLTSEKDVKKALTSGFMEVDRSLGTSRIDCEFSGSTAVVAHLKGHTLTTAWVGDSRGVLGRDNKKGSLDAVELTSDHKPTSPDEKARILRSNGRVERLVDEVGQPMGPFRVWLQYAWIPGLAMSRALGDVLAHQVGVVSEPDFTQVELTPDDRFIILASDGVWEFISNKEAVDIAAQYDSAEEACRQLVDEAYQRWLTEEEGVVDDITAVIVKFQH